MAGKKRPDKNSTTALVDQFANAGVAIPPPDGVEFGSDKERLLWDQFTRARARQDWRDMDLILLSKIVKLEADIRKHQEMVDRSGAIIQNKRGTLHENPLLKVIDTLERRQLAVIRVLSLTQQHSDPRTMSANAKAESEAEDIMEMFKSSGLIPMPSRSN